MVSFQASDFTDRLQDILHAKTQQMRNGFMIKASHINRLIGLIVSASKNNEQALSVAEAMPTKLFYGQFRLDCATMRWVILE